MKKLLFAGFTAIAAIASSAGAQRISPQSIIVNPVQTDLQVNVWTDRSNQGSNPVYGIGERIKLSVNVNQDAYVYLFSVHSDGQVDLILPNRLSGGNEFLRAGETRSFPGSGAAYQLNVDGPVGQDKVLAVAAKRPLDLSEIASFRGNSAFADVQVSGQNGLARALSIVVQPVPPSDWVTNVAYFQVRGFVGSATPSPAPVINTKPAAPPSVTYQYGLERYGLNLFPGARFVRFVNVDTDAEVELLFFTDASMQSIADHYRRICETRGWTLRKGKIKSDSIRLEFRKPGSKLMLEVEREVEAFRLTVNVS